MKSKMKLLKWIPVAVAALVAAYQSIGEIKEEERLDGMEERIAKLESNEEA